MANFLLGFAIAMLLIAQLVKSDSLRRNFARVTEYGVFENAVRCDKPVWTVKETK